MLIQFREPVEHQPGHVPPLLDPQHSRPERGPNHPSTPTRRLDQEGNFLIPPIMPILRRSIGKVGRVAREWEPERSPVHPDLRELHPYRAEKASEADTQESVCSRRPKSLTSGRRANSKGTFINPPLISPSVLARDERHRSSQPRAACVPPCVPQRCLIGGISNDRSRQPIWLFAHFPLSSTAFCPSQSFEKTDTDKP